MERMNRIHALLVSGRRVSSRTLAREPEVSYKTVQRDIIFMRDRFELPIDYDSRAHGYFYSQAVTHFPTVTVSEGELLALFVAGKALAQYRGTAFQKPLRAAFAKLTAALPEQIGFGWEALDAVVSFRGEAKGQGSADLRIFQVASHAVLHNRELEFDYRKLAGGGQVERRGVQPLHLGCFGNQWYLIAQDLGKAATRTFALSRMENARETGGHFVRPAGFSPTEFLADSFGITAGQKPQRVRVQFTPAVARLIRERVWHPTQKFRELAGGGVELELRVGIAPELEHWLLGWGGEARIVEPAHLRALLCERARRAWEVNGDAPGPQK